MYSEWDLDDSSEETVPELCTSQQGTKSLAYLYFNVLSCVVSHPPISTPAGPLHVEFSQTVNLKNVEAENPEVREGGRYTPQDCRALQKVALIIPFRNRDEHLKYWLYYLHPILQRQQLDYGVYVINQVSPRLWTACIIGEHLSFSFLSDMLFFTFCQVHK